MDGMIDKTKASPSLHILADIFSQPGGSQPEMLRTLSIHAAKPVSSIIETVLSSRGEQMQESLSSLASDLSEKGSAADWLDLGRIAAGLFYRHAAEGYFEKSVQVAKREGDYSLTTKLI